MFNTFFPQWPNPNLLNVDIEVLNPESIRIYNALGQLEILELDPKSNNRIDVSALLSGLHFVEITFEEDTVVKQVILH
ncbi:MAG: T9SS type A sorting domain-containing protein [Bacteroidota bacterium]